MWLNHKLLFNHILAPTVALTFYFVLFYFISCSCMSSYSDKIKLNLQLLGEMNWLNPRFHLEERYNRARWRLSNISNNNSTNDKCILCFCVVIFVLFFSPSIWKKNNNLTLKFSMHQNAPKRRSFFILFFIYIFKTFCAFLCLRVHCVTVRLTCSRDFCTERD